MQLQLTVYEWHHAQHNWVVVGSACVVGVYGVWVVCQ